MRVSRALKARSRTSLAALAGGILTLGMVTAGVAATAANAAPARPAAATTSACSLDGGAIKHVIYLQFDNVHYTRDNPNVPSDLEQMPNLLNFITGNGTLVSHEHTPLIAHTADDIVTSESGLYGSDQGDAIANEYRYYTGAANGSTDTAGSFAYWEDPVVDYDTSYRRPGGRLDDHAGRAERQDPAGAVGVLHQGGLRRRLRGRREHRAGEHHAGRAAGVRRELAGRQGGRRR